MLTGLGPTESGKIDLVYGLINEIKARSGQRETLLGILLEASQNMPGCRSYVVAVDEGNDDTIWVTEVWDDQASHDASLQLPSVRHAIERARPLIAAFGQRIVSRPIGGHGLEQ